MNNTQNATKADKGSLGFKILIRDVLRIQDRVKNIEYILTKVHGKLDRLQNTMDSFVGSVDTLRTEYEIGTHQTRKLQLQASDHEKRLRHFESSKPAA